MPILSARAGTDQSRLLEQLAGLAQALVLPRLRLGDQQSLSQACRATRAIVHSLPERSCSSWLRWSLANCCCHQVSASALRRSCAQGQQLPERAGSSSRQQLDQWAVHMATVRSGNLQLSRRLSLADCYWAELSPQLDYVAAIQRGRPALTLFRMPGSAMEVDLPQQLEAVGQDLAMPNPQPPEMEVAELRCESRQTR